MCNTPIFSLECMDLYVNIVSMWYMISSVELKVKASLVNDQILKENILYFKGMCH